MDDLKQWLKKILKIAGIFVAVQLLALLAGKVVPLLPFAEGCEGGGFSCPKGRGVAFDEVKYLDSFEDVQNYYGWDYVIGGCGWMSIVSEATGCEFSELEKDESIPSKSYNFISWGTSVPVDKLGKEVPLIRCSMGRGFGEWILPFSGYSCEYGSIGCSGCYSCGVQSWLGDSEE